MSVYYEILIFKTKATQEHLLEWIKYYFGHDELLEDLNWMSSSQRVLILIKETNLNCLCPKSFEISAMLKHKPENFHT